MAGKTSGKILDAASPRTVLLLRGRRTKSEFRVRIFRSMLPQALPLGDFCVKQPFELCHISH